MSRSNSDYVITIDLRRPVRRALILAPALIAIVAAWFSAAWYIGDTVAEYAPENEQASIDLAKLATRWAPNDPFAHWTLAALESKQFSADNLADAAREYQIAVTLSPNDYRYWLELGRGLEASGDNPNAERALHRAVELAPAYSEPRWFFGNLLLREGKVDEAFQQLSRAGESNSTIRNQVFNVATQVFGDDVDAIAKAVCLTNTMRVQLATYLASRQKGAEAIRVWEATPNRANEREVAEEFRKQLIDARLFRAASEVSREIEPDKRRVPTPEQFIDGGFENGADLSSSDGFGWSIASSSLVQATLDAQAHSGHNSLRLVFRAPNKLETIHVSQTIMVEPETAYHLECYARTQDLISGAAPLIEIDDAKDNAPLVVSPPLATGTNEWQRIVIDFKTKKSDGVIVKLARQSCGENQPCPIFGTVWYDDFNLQRGGASTANRERGAGEKH